MKRSRHFVFRYLITVPVLGLLLNGCGENVLGPLNNTIFVLESVDDVALPATVADPFGGLGWVVTADTIWFESGSRWKRHSVQWREDGVGGEPLDQETEGAVIRQGGLLILSFECADSSCIAPDRVAENLTMLQMDETYLHAGQRLIFRR